LFLASIVALDGKTGKYKWHYQVNPGETWDFTATQDMAFAELDVKGKRRKVLMTAPKNGFFYVLDRQTGQLISAEPFAKVNWASKIDLKNGRPVENPQARYPDGTKALVWPIDRGAHNWTPMAYSPVTKYAYIPVLEKASTWTDLGVKKAQWEQMMPPGTAQTAAWMDLYPELHDPLDGTTKLLAWDVRRQKAVWSQPTSGPIGSRPRGPLEAASWLRLGTWYLAAVSTARLTRTLRIAESWSGPFRQMRRSSRPLSATRLAIPSM
jgi:quinohemoprotein ethanol dehydrogenase